MGFIRFAKHLILTADVQHSTHETIIATAKIELENPSIFQVRLFCQAIFRRRTHLFELIRTVLSCFVGFNGATPGRSQPSLKLTHTAEIDEPYSSFPSDDLSGTLSKFVEHSI